MQKSKKGEQPNPVKNEKPLRLLPGVIIVAIQLLLILGTPIVLPDVAPYAMLAGILGLILIIVWWVFFSRAPIFEKIVAPVLMVIAMIVTRNLLHTTLAKGGMGMIYFIFVAPGLSLAFVIWAVVSPRLSKGPRRIWMVVSILLACGIWALFQTGGVDAVFKPDLKWRWSVTPEEHLLTAYDEETTSSGVISESSDVVAQWPGFRGAKRDGVVLNTAIDSDWSSSMPVELWRRPVGPGWSSFSVRGDFFFTQEQRGDEEAVSCYNLASGNLVWMHKDAVRFWESNAGAGPRGTPHLHDGLIFTLGGTGLVNALKVDDGSVVWTRNAAKDTDTGTPYWGFSGSPVTWNDQVIVAVGGSLISYSAQNGDQNWSVPVGGDCYSSPQVFEIGGFEQILFQNNAGVMSVDPVEGKLLWEHAWKGQPCVQPTFINENEILISVGEKSGIKRIAIQKKADDWVIEERWTSTRLKPYFNDSVIHKDAVFGFDGPFLACIDAVTGERRWRGARYGRGQFILLADQDLLIVLSEKGDLALVEAAPDRFSELAKIPAIKGKTWNHPVLVDDILLVRNAQEMAAFRLPLTSD